MGVTLPPEPAALTDWVKDEDPNKVAEPSAAKKALGLVANERPSFKLLNFLWARHQNWIEFLRDSVRLIAPQTLKYDSIVGAGPGATHADLEEALADSNLGPDSQILVIDAKALTTKIQLTKDGWLVEFRQGAFYTDNGAGVGIELLGDRITLINPSMKGFATAGIEVKSAADHARIIYPRFGSNAKDVLDGAVNTIIIGPITET